jgi:hypothetical protein
VGLRGDKALLDFRNEEVPLGEKSESAWQAACEALAARGEKPVRM